MKLLFVLIALLPQAWGMPTAEGLFRNANNKELTGNLIVVTAMIERMPMMAGQSETAQVQQEVTLAKPLYYKWLLSLERDKLVDMIQVTYDQAQMKENQVRSTRYLPDLLKVVGSDNSLERSLFYGLMGVLALNRSELIAPTLTKYAQGFVTNAELMSRDKKNLYQQYKEYLEMKKKDEDVEANSPLKPEDPERAKAVSEILAAPMYRDAENVELVRIRGKLQWKVDLKNMLAYFSNEDHRLRQIDYQSPLGDISIRADDYVLFDGAHELPKTVIINDMSGAAWRLRFLGLSHLNNKRTPFTKRAQQYASAAKEGQSGRDQEEVATQINPPFIF